MLKVFKVRYDLIWLDFREIFFYIVKEGFEYRVWGYEGYLEVLGKGELMFIEDLWYIRYRVRFFIYVVILVFIVNVWGRNYNFYLRDEVK